MPVFNAILISGAGFSGGLASFPEGLMPSWQAWVGYGPVCAVCAWGFLFLAGWLKRKGWKTGYTRKVFHFLVFATVALLQWQLDVKAVVLFGTACSLVIFYAVVRGRGNLLYEALAREKDEPRRTWFIVIPYLATLTGGLAGNLLFGPHVMAGYLVTGIGDAVGEPVGARWGKHRYRVFSLRGTPAVRSLEGSLAVFVASAMVLLALGVISPLYDWSVVLVGRLLVIALSATATEALSPHGWDNLTLQLVPSALALLWLAPPAG